MSWAEPVETPAGLREPRMVRGLRWPRMAADLPQTAGWTSRRRRRRFPANGEQGRAAAGGGPLPREQNQETKTFKNGRKTKPGGSGAEVTLFWVEYSVTLYGGIQERGNFIYKHGDRGRHEHKGMTLILDKDTGNTEDL